MSSEERPVGASIFELTRRAKVAADKKKAEKEAAKQGGAPSARGGSSGRGTGTGRAQTGQRSSTKPGQRGQAPPRPQRGAAQQQGYQQGYDPYAEQGMEQGYGDPYGQQQMMQQGPPPGYGDPEMDMFDHAAMEEETPPEPAKPNVVFITAPQAPVPAPAPATAPAAAATETSKASKSEGSSESSFLDKAKKAGPYIGMGGLALAAGSLIWKKVRG